MHEAISSYTAKAAEKLRGEKQRCQVLGVFLRTGMFNPNDPIYSNSASVRLEYPTDDTRALLHEARRLVDCIWKDGYRYAKAGITLTDFYDQNTVQPDLFNQRADTDDCKALMRVVDKLNQQARGRVFFASQGTGKAWRMKQNHLSPTYTTDWNGLLKVK